MTKPSKVRCSHILLSWDQAFESTHSRELVFAIHDAKEIIASLKGGGYTWQAAVKEHSACPHSWVSDGDLGWFKFGEVTPELWNACLICPIDELLEEPVQSPYGIHIITRTG